MYTKCVFHFFYTSKNMFIFVCQFNNFSFFLNEKPFSYPIRPHMSSLDDMRVETRCDFEFLKLYICS